MKISKGLFKSTMFKDDSSHIISCSCQLPRAGQHHVHGRNRTLHKPHRKTSTWHSSGAESWWRVCSSQNILHHRLAGLYATWSASDFQTVASFGNFLLPIKYILNRNIVIFGDYRTYGVPWFICLVDGWQHMHASVTVGFLAGHCCFGHLMGAPCKEKLHKLTNFFQQVD